MLGPLHYEAEDCKQRELFKHRLAMRARVEKAEAKPYPDERVKKIVEPRKKAHHAELVKKVVPREYADGPTQEENPIRPYEIKLHPFVAVSHHDKERGVDGKYESVIEQPIACSENFSHAFSFHFVAAMNPTA
jgi:hypothetical protein